jgi:hypothetical protein
MHTGMSLPARAVLTATPGPRASRNGLHRLVGGHRQRLLRPPGPGIADDHDDDRGVQRQERVRRQSGVLGAAGGMPSALQGADDAGRPGQADPAQGTQERQYDSRGLAGPARVDDFLGRDVGERPAQTEPEASRG